MWRWHYLVKRCLFSLDAYMISCPTWSKNLKRYLLHMFSSRNCTFYIPLFSKSYFLNGNINEGFLSSWNQDEIWLTIVVQRILNPLYVKYRGPILRVMSPALGSNDLSLDQSGTSIQILPEPNAVSDSFFIKLRL